MTDITKSIITWVECCQTIWEQYFSQREDGADEFINVEQSLLESLVLSDLRRNGMQINLDSFWNSICVEYVAGFSGNKQCFVTQKNGNLLGKPMKIVLQKGSILPVKYIDPTGTMNNGIPYIEAKFEQFFFLESLDEVKVLLR